MDDIHKEELGALEEILDGRNEPRKLSLSFLKYITQDFSHERKIGYGESGEVYKVLSNVMPDVVKQEEDAAPSPQGARLQRDLSPMGEACFRMDITAIHKILVDRQYRDDVELSELSLQEWTQQVWDTWEARKRGDYAFGDKDFPAAIDSYTESMDVGPEMVSRTVYVRRSWCYIMCDKMDAALRDAMQAERQYPDWPYSLYMQATELEENQKRKQKKRRT